MGKGEPPNSISSLCEARRLSCRAGERLQQTRQSHCPNPKGQLLSQDVAAPGWRLPNQNNGKTQGTGLQDPGGGTAGFGGPLRPPTPNMSRHQIGPDSGCSTGGAGTGGPHQPRLLPKPWVETQRQNLNQRSDSAAVHKGYNV